MKAEGKARDSDDDDDGSNSDESTDDDFNPDAGTVNLNGITGHFSVALNRENWFEGCPTQFLMNILLCVSK